MSVEILANPKLNADQVQCNVLKTGRNHRDYLVSNLDEDLKKAREKLEKADSDRRKRKFGDRISKMETRLKELEGVEHLARVEPVFVVPNKIYAKYQENTDIQFRVSNALLELLRETVGSKRVDNHVFRIKILPEDTDEFWRTPKPTNSEATPQPQNDKTPLFPLDQLGRLFDEAVA